MAHNPLSLPSSLSPLLSRPLRATLSFPLTPASHGQRARWRKAAAAAAGAARARARGGQAVSCSGENTVSRTKDRPSAHAPREQNSPFPSSPSSHSSPSPPSPSLHSCSSSSSSSSTSLLSSAGRAVKASLTAGVAAALLLCIPVNGVLAADGDISSSSSSSSSSLSASPPSPLPTVEFVAKSGARLALPVSWVIAADRPEPPGRQKETLTLVGNFRTVETISIIRLPTDESLRKDAAADDVADAVALKGNVRTQFISTQVEVLPADIAEAVGASKMYTLEYVSETCRGVVEEVSGGRTLCTGPRDGQELTTVIRHHAAVAIVRKDVVYTATASCKEEDWEGQVGQELRATLRTFIPPVVAGR